MNNFAGIISFSPAAGDGGFAGRLQQLFPARLGGQEALRLPQLQVLGEFEASGLNDSAATRLLLQGELFNTAELSRSLGIRMDGKNAATLLHALLLEKGIDALAAVNGQFLIVYSEPDKQRIHLINDHSGVQQVFCHQGKDFFLFASDIKYLLAHPACPAEIDWESGLRRPRGYTVMHSHRSYATWFKGVQLLPEATDCRILYEKGEVAQTRYWNGLYDYRMAAASDGRSAGEVMEEYMALLDDAVRIRIQDGSSAHSFLSGGLDSSAICALAARHRTLESYSIITQTTMLEDTTGVCDRLSKDLGFRNEQFLIPYHELVYDKERWKARIWRMESPVNHTDALTKNLLHYAISAHHSDVPYVLTGTGSDQYNGGLVRWVVTDEETEAVSAEAFFNKVKDAEMLRHVGRDEDTYWRIRNVLNRDAVAQFGGGRAEANYWMYYVQSALHGETYSLLWDELRAASAHGRSVRFPFLDYRFAQFFAGVPERLHRELFYDKQILRTPARKLLPAYVTDKGKAPSFIPGYDFRFRLFDSLTSGPDSLLEQAFGDRATPHPVIDKEQLWKRVAAMKAKPEIYEWQELIQIINLGLLEQLAGRDEAALAFEKGLEVPPLVRFDDPAAVRQSLRSRLSVKEEAELLALPLQFGEGCGLMQDFKTGVLFLSKNNTLVYELDAEYAAWIALLKAVDGKKSTQQILAETDGDFEGLREFFMLALKEQLLAFSDAPDTVPNDTFVKGKTMI